MIAKQENLSNGSFTIVENEVLKDETLSIGARMFYALARSFSSDWNINIKHFSKLMGVSENSVRKFRNELVNAGILGYRQLRDEKGRLTQENLYAFKSFEIVSVDEMELENNQVESMQENLEKQALDSTLSLSETESAESQSAANGQSYPFNKISVCGKFEDIIILNKLNNINSNLEAHKNLSALKAKETAQENPTQQSALDSSQEKPKTTLRPKRLFFVVQESLRQFSDYGKLELREYKQKLPMENYSEAEQEAFKDFIKYRKERGFLARSTIDSIVKDFEKLKEAKADLRACVDLCINRGWSGLLKAQEAILRYESYKQKPQSPSRFYTPLKPNPLDRLKA